MNVSLCVSVLNKSIIGSNISYITVMINSQFSINRTESPMVAHCGLSKVTLVKLDDGENANLQCGYVLSTDFTRIVIDLLDIKPVISIVIFHRYLFLSVNYFQQHNIPCMANVVLPPVISWSMYTTCDDTI